MKVEDAIEMAVRDFRENIATYTRGEKFDVLDFKRPNTICYWIRMVFDHERDGTQAVYISGDCGEAVIYPTCEPTLEGMAKCFTRRVDGKIDVNEPYFMEKFKASSDKYDWDADKFKEDLRESVREAFDEGAEEPLRKLEEFFDDYMDTFSPKVWVDSVNGPMMGGDAVEELNNILPDCSEYLYSYGRSVSVRVIMWLVALRLAWEQVRDQEKGKSNEQGKSGSSGEDPIG